MDTVEEHVLNSITSFKGQYSFLSNYFNAVVTFEGEQYPTAEHAFQAAKTLDLSERKRIASLATPGQSKRAGRELTLRKDWEEIKVTAMTVILKSKFSDPILSRMLDETGDAILIEGNTWHDNIWGSCTCRDCGNKGKNQLGKILMTIRAMRRYNGTNTNR